MKSLLQKLSALALPPTCVSCGAMADANHKLCHKCWADIHFISQPHCEICGIPMEFEIEEEKICEKCLKDRPEYNKARAVCAYGDVVIKMVTNFKYYDRHHIAPSMADMMLKSCHELIKRADIMVPIPLHKSRLISRKYNQATILARRISAKSGVPMDINILRRVKQTRQQTRLSRSQRFDNMEGAFEVIANVEGKTILLIDDVLTTGATANSAAFKLKQAGAKCVDVAVFARTGLNSSSRM